VSLFCSPCSEKERLGEQKVMSGEDGWWLAWYGMWVYCEVSLSMYMLLVCVTMSLPLGSSMLYVYQTVFFALKSPAIIVLGGKTGVCNGLVLCLKLGDVYVDYVESLFVARVDT